MQYASLASGSKGNCHALKNDNSIFLIDVGISLLQIQKRLESIGWDFSKIQAVAITHEHGDHIAALEVILRNTSWTILATSKTRDALIKNKNITIPEARWKSTVPNESFEWNLWTITPFTIPHDAADTVAHRISYGGQTIAVITDLGHISKNVIDHCQGLDGLVVEANHDETMLLEGGYPEALKSRIHSNVGHLNNTATGSLLRQIDQSNLQVVILAHLSEENNNPDLAKSCVAPMLSNKNIRLLVADQRVPLAIDLAL